MNILVLNPPNRFEEKINRDLIYGCWCKGNRVSNIQLPNLTLLYIATVIKQAGYNVKLVDALAENKKLEDLLNIIENFDAVIVSTSNTTFREDVYVLSELKKKNERLKTIICGAHPTVYPDCIKEEHIDFGIQREIEQTTVDLLDAMENKKDFGNVLGISYKKDGKIFVNAMRPFIKNLDELPFPDRTLINKDQYFHPLAERLPFTTMMTSRGCIGRCIMCTSPDFYGHIYRMRSPENILKEMELVQQQGYKEVLIRDETFTVNKQRAMKMCEGIIERKIDLTWSCNSRVDTIDEELAIMMKRAGCHTVWFGVESGDQEILDKMKKGVKVETIENTFKVLHKVGMKTHAHFIFGNVGETRESVKKSIAFMKKIKPTTVDIGITTPFPGTELFNMIKEKTEEIGDGTQLPMHDIHTKTFFNKYICELSDSELEQATFDAYKAFYMRPSYVADRFIQVRSFSELMLVLRGAVSVLMLFGFKRT